MGIWGWDELIDNVQLRGFVVGPAFYEGNDDDWNFSVKPSASCQSLLENKNGGVNSDGDIGCEIQAPVTLDVDEFLNNGTHAIANQWVTVVGTWVRDRSHSADGSSPLLGTDNGKTEIHPITSLLVERAPAADNRSRLVDFFVFSSGGSITIVNIGPRPNPSAPHTDEDRLGAFDIPIPLEATPNVTVRAQQSPPPDFQTDPTGRFAWFRGRVRSGKYSEGQGFFSATIELPGFTLLTYLVSRGINFRFGIRDLMKWAGVSSIRALFARLDTGEFEPPVCAGLNQQIASVTSQIGQVNRAIADVVNAGGKPPEDLVTEKAELEGNLTDLETKKQEFGCR